ncbi:MAG: tRNA (adenosine(37)-N6)-threonylcarbamoyltransferase complex dimerization subunit type 1 TsaB [Hyphomicrobium sp.]
MNILAFDTCFGVCSAALGINLQQSNSSIFSRSEVMNIGHAERLLPMINELLTESHLSVEHIDRIVVTCGPGSFTGVRISIAAARAFQLARQIPIIPFTSLEAIALNSEINEIAMGKDLIVAVDANRGEAYVQIFDGNTKDPLGEPQLLAEKDFAQLAREQPVIVVGTAAEKVALSLNTRSKEAQFYNKVLWPGMCETIIKALSRPTCESRLEPVYIREPDAKPQDPRGLLA